MSKIAIVYHSGYGHTARQAEAVGRGVTAGGGELTMLKVDELVDAEAPGWAALDAADAIVFGAPTYMGSASGPFKIFMDATSKRWMTRAWVDKIAAGFTNSGAQNGDKGHTLTGFVVLAMQHGMIWVGNDLMPGNNSSSGSPDDLNRMGVALGAASQSNVDASPDVAPPASDLRTAEHFGQRIAKVTARFRPA